MTDHDPGQYAVELIRRVAGELLREHQQLNSSSPFGGSDPRSGERKAIVARLPRPSADCTGAAPKALP